ncbi:MAG: amino acid permease [Candidatus Aenigmarchaeota archaeon]|nr:amino acid permease [Candidatus Aenigmarchaeota archaeon]
MPKSRKNATKLDRILDNLSAPAISIGGIIGSGIFFIIGIAAGVAGSGLVISLLLGGLVAFLTALSFASLSSKIPKEGGEYQFVYKAFGRKLGMFTGIMWLLITAIGGVTASLALGSYFFTLFPILSPNIIAAIVCIAFVSTDLVGLRFSSKINNIFVITKVAVLLLFIALTIPAVKLANFNNVLATGKEGILAGTFLIFFAYAGFGKVTAAAEEVKNARKTLPLAIVEAIIVCTLIYLIIGFTSVGSIGAETLASPRYSTAPLGFILSDLGYQWGFVIISIGAVIATANVVLIQVLGLSRTIFAMSKNKQLPNFLSELHPRFKTPYKAETILAILMAATAMLLNFRTVIALTGLGILAYYSLVNLSAIVVLKKKWFDSHRILSILGFLSCIGLILYYLITVGIPIL